MSISLSLQPAPTAPTPRPWALAAWAGAAIVALGALLALGHLPLPSDPALSLCLFRRLTGIPCPGCGMTRAMAALARGDIVAALRFHPFAPVLLAEAALVWGAIGRDLWRRRPFSPSSRLMEQAMIWQGAALLALWLGRAATGTLPW